MKEKGNLFQNSNSSKIQKATGNWNWSEKNITYTENIFDMFRIPNDPIMINWVSSFIFLLFQPTFHSNVCIVWVVHAGVRHNTSEAGRGISTHTGGYLARGGWDVEKRTTVGELLSLLFGRQIGRGPTLVSYTSEREREHIREPLRIT